MDDKNECWYKFSTGININVPRPSIQFETEQNGTEKICNKLCKLLAGQKVLCKNGDKF